ncbi:hypothetical protein HDU97_003939 [Phlyctochytrium planicorne]|nr:hypothetical protein HDU97_003939 [Phlyctochytrium planicorne]
MLDVEMETDADETATSPTTPIPTLTGKSIAVEVIYSICQWLSNCNDLKVVAMSCKSTAHLVRDPFLLATAFSNRSPRVSISSRGMKISNISPLTNEQLLSHLPGKGSSVVRWSNSLTSISRSFFSLLIHSLSACTAIVRYSTPEQLCAALQIKGKKVLGRRLEVENEKRVSNDIKYFQFRRTLSTGTAAIVDWCRKSTTAQKRPWGVVHTLCLGGADPNAGFSNIGNHREFESYQEEILPLMNAVVNNQVDLLVELLECEADPTFMFPSLITQAVARKHSFLAQILTSYPYAKCHKIPIPHFLTTRDLDRKFCRKYHPEGMMETALSTSANCNALRLFSYLLEESSLILGFKPGSIKVSRCLDSILSDPTNPIRLNMLVKLIKHGISLLSSEGLRAVAKASENLAVTATSILVTAIGKELVLKGGFEPDWASTILVPDARSYQIRAASLLGDIKTVDVLLNLNFDGPYGPTTHSIESALNIALHARQKDVLQRILQDERIPQAHVLSISTLKQFVNQGTEMTTALLDSRIIKLFKEDGTPGENFDIMNVLLQIAFKSGKLDVIKYLLEKRSGLPIIDSDTDLFWQACREEKTDIAALFLEHGIFMARGPRYYRSLAEDPFFVILFRKFAPTCSVKVLGFYPTPDACHAVWVAFERFVDRIRDAEANELIMFDDMISDDIIPNISFAVKLFVLDILAKSDKDWKEIREKHTYYASKITVLKAVAKAVKSKNVGSAHMETTISVKSLAVEIIYSICQWLDSCHDLRSVSMSCKSTSHLIGDPFLIAAVFTNRAKTLSIASIPLKVSNISASMPVEQILQRLPEEGRLSCDIEGFGRNCTAVVRYDSPDRLHAALQINGRATVGRRLKVVNYIEVRDAIEFFKARQTMKTSTAALVDWCKNSTRKKMSIWGVIHTLCLNGADPDAGMGKIDPNNPPPLLSSHEGMFPLMNAIISDDVDMLAELLECGADPTVMFSRLITEAIHRKHYHTAQFLATYPYAKTHKIPIPHFLASLELDRTFARKYDHSGMMESALSTAIGFDAQRIFNSLVEESYLILAYNPDAINVAICLDKIPLYPSAPTSIAMLSKLIKHGLNLLNREGLFAVTKAARALAVDATLLLVDAIKAELLLKGGTDRDWASTGADDARSHQIKAASLLGDVSSVDFLLDILSTDTFGPSTASIEAALKIAILNKQKGVLRRLLRDDRLGKNHVLSERILHLFVDQGPEVVEILLESDIVQIFNEDGTPGEDFRTLGRLLQITCSIGATELARYLLQKRAGFSIIIPNTGTNLFWTACQCANADLAALLLVNGIYSSYESDHYFHLGRDNLFLAFFRKIAPKCSLHVFGLFPSPETGHSIWVAFHQLVHRIRDAQVNEVLTLSKLESDGFVSDISHALLLFTNDIMAKSKEDWEEIRKERCYLMEICFAEAVAMAVKSKNIAFS